MFYWYQKEYASGELYQAFWDIAVIFQSGVFETAFTKIKKLEADFDVLELMLYKLTCLVVSTSYESSLIVKPGSFRLKEKVGQGCLCRKTSRGWIFEIEGSDSFDSAINLGWQKLSNEHPLANTVVTVGPSRHVNLCRND